MPEVEEQLRRYGAALEHELLREETTPVALVAPPGSGHRRPLIAGVLVVAAIATATVLVVLSDDDRSSVITQPPGSTGLFSSETGVVLLFSDGIDGVTAVDLDRRIGARRVIQGERAGDQPFRLTLTGEHLVVGWGEIFAQPLDGSAPRKLDEATIYIPASEPGEVWTVSWGGGRIGQGSPTVRRVTVDGDIVVESDSLDTAEWYPLLGVPGGLVVQSGTGIAVWDAATSTVGPVLGPGPAFSIASDGRRLAWCEDTCAATHLAALPKTGPPTARHVSAGSQLALAPDGERLAVLKPSEQGPSLVLTDLATGRESVAAKDLPNDGSIQWTEDGSQLFYTENSYQRPTSRVGRYIVATRTWEERTIPFGDSLGAVVITREQARSFFASDLVEPQDCPGAGGHYPSGREGVCSFRF